MFRHTCIVALSLVMIASWSRAALGQNNNRDRAAERAAEARQRMVERFTELLQCTEEEWAILQPRVERVIALQNVAGVASANLAGMMGRRFRMPTVQTEAATEVQISKQDLEKTLVDSGASNNDLKIALEAARQARAQARADLERAQAELISLLTLRQEAVLFQMGLLD